MSFQVERVDSLGACGGQGDAANQDRVSKSHDQEGENSEADPSHPNNAFGVIKDISVNNICASDFDKTKDFEKKDFSQIYLKCQPMAEMERVFEPRPGGQDYQSLAKKLHLPPTNTSGTVSPSQRHEWTRGDVSPTSTRRPDVWVEQTSANSRGSHYISGTMPRSTRDSQQGPPRSPRDTQPYCPLSSASRSARDQQPYCPLSSVSRSPKDTCPLASPFSRSPRETCPLASVSRSPRDRRSYSGYESESSSRNAPDLLRVAPPRRCTSWGDASYDKSPYEGLGPQDYSLDTGCMDSVFDTNIYEDDDPGPQLDAVLRSLSKLTAHLGDDDDDLFPNFQDEPPLPPPLAPQSLSSHHGSDNRHGSDNHYSMSSHSNTDTASHSNSGNHGNSGQVLQLTRPTSNTTDRQNRNAVFTSVTNQTEVTDDDEDAVFV